MRVQRHPLRDPGDPARAGDRDRARARDPDSALAIGIGWIPIFVRVVRAPVLSLRNADFVRAGQVLGFSRRRVLFRHILPSVYGVIAVQTSLALAWAILADASLSFLGLGPPPPAASLGEMVENSSSLVGIAWWTLAAPSLAIIIAVVGFNYLGDGLRDAADPRADGAAEGAEAHACDRNDLGHLVRRDRSDRGRVRARRAGARRRPAGARLCRVPARTLAPRSRRCCRRRRPPIEAVCRLDTAIGHRFAEVAAEVAEAAFGGEADVICSHGQTVYHWVEGAHALGTLQLGQPAFIAERTGATVVGDVRARDIAAGGHGAPLASLLDVLLLGRSPDRVRGSLNLGGISNVTVVGPASEPLAYDIGPANALTDAVVAAETGGRESWDEGGARAARGTGERRATGRLPRRAVLRAGAPEVDRQGALPSRLRAREGRRPCDLDRRPARDADRPVGRDRSPADLKKLGVPTSSPPAAAPATRR